MINDQYTDKNTVSSLYLSAGYEKSENELHDHDCYELLFLESGERNVMISNKEYTLCPGEVLFICPNQQHCLFINDNNSGNFFNVHFYPQALSSVFLNRSLMDELNLISKQKILHIKFTENDQLDVLYSFSSILQAVSEESVINELFLRAHTLTLVAWIIEKCNCKTNESSGFEENNHSKKIFEIIQYVNHHYTENLKLTSLSQKYYISYSHLSRQFKKITSKNFNEYVNELRLKKALFLIASTNIPIAEISSMIGFGKHSHFTELFFRRYRITPLKFRHLFYPKLSP